MPVPTSNIISASAGSITYGAPVTFSATISASTGTGAPSGTITFFDALMPASVLFNGSSNYLHNDTTPPVGNYPITMAAWVKINSSTNGVIMGIFKATGSPNQCAQMYVDGSARLNCDWESGGSGINLASSSAIPLNVMAHVACVFDSGNQKVYINGVQKGSAGNSLPAVTSIDRLLIGANNYNSVGVSAFFNGSIGQAAIWHSVVNATDIASMAAGADMSGFSPTRLWNLNGYAYSQPSIPAGYSLTAVGTAGGTAVFCSSQSIGTGTALSIGSDLSTAMFATSSLAVASHFIAASYPGDLVFAGSDSTGLTLNVIPAPVFSPYWAIYSNLLI